MLELVRVFPFLFSKCRTELAVLLMGSLLHGTEWGTGVGAVEVYPNAVGIPHYQLVPTFLWILLDSVAKKKRPLFAVITVQI